MFNQAHYVPILKWKRGEQKALEFLAADNKQYLTPLIEIMPIPYDYKNSRPAKTIDEHLHNIGRQISDSWGTRAAFIDLLWLNTFDRLNDGRDPLTYIMDESRSYGLNLIPVLGTQRDVSYKNAVLQTNNHDHNGVCVRLEEVDFLNIFNRIKSILSDLHIEPESIDLIIDFKQISTNDDARNIIMSSTIINSIPHINRWRTFTISWSAFPENLSNIVAGQISLISRSEWHIWQGLKARERTLNRMPSFGDYVINNPNYNEIDPRFMQMSANIRYTTENNFLISRGRSIKKHGWVQAMNLCNTIINHPQYNGQNYSWGDQYIYDCANGNSSTGNAETWRRVGTNHHLTLVTNRISSFLAP